MMNIIDVAGYFIKNSKIVLSKGRLNKLIYLADWKNCLEHNEQLTTIQWKFNHYGPYVDEIQNVIGNDSKKRIVITNKINYFGSTKYELSVKKDDFIPPTEQQKAVLDLILQVTNNLNWSDFINLVYSTYPIKVSIRGEIMDLVKLSTEYKDKKYNTK
ncbi:Panacea domain-containing protein [Helicobacter trogontum]|uniref:Panacea domain-containing protein n=1 Tax=Helicobacter trogontum TaxID=50960 RepID=UPI002A911019|nr:Panacea domain-containing protein [Helicobacter trogontum]MDY5186050.1 Panacea domain-containing protein [Helicobacter trogontum]